MLKIDGVPQRDNAESAESSTRASAPGCLHELFERQADARGSAPALVCGEVSLSYSALELRANRLAHHIRQLGVERGALVGIAFDRSELPIIAILACLKAGAAYLPLDPDYPRDRLAFVVDEEHILASTLAQFLRQEGLDARSSACPIGVLDSASISPPDLLISDVAPSLYQGSN
jgi:non-ribosomal peptide synthetase component F